jgi:hypothetical protein
MNSVIEENILKLRKEHKAKQEELEALEATSIQQMWLTELAELKTAYEQGSQQVKENQGKEKPVKIRKRKVKS